MIFKIEKVSDPLLEGFYEKAMGELNDFYEINWEYNRPWVIAVPDRKTIDAIRGTKTPRWLTGWSDGRSNYILDRNNYGAESEKKYSEAEYEAELKHELSHSFFNILAGAKNIKPMWIVEGVAIYTSGQNPFKRKPASFNNFLQFYDEAGEGVYYESGFAVEVLIQKFGKKKLLGLISRLKNAKNKTGFNKLFKDTYSKSPTYSVFNSWLKEMERGKVA